MASGNVRVGIAQMDCVVGDVAANLETVERFARQARREGCDFVVYPELSMSGYAVGMGFAEASLTPDCREVRMLRKLSREIGLSIGFIEETEDTEFFNSAMFLHDGRIRHVHRKVYLPNYRVFDERRHYGMGHTVRAFDTPWGRMAILICGDAWHLSMPYLAVHDGADIILTMAASSRQGLSPDIKVNAAWERLNQTCALSLTSFVVFANRVGSEMLKGNDTKLDFWGGSHVCHPDGSVLKQAAFDQEDLLVAELDLNMLRKHRIILPFRRDDDLGFMVNQGRTILRAKRERRHGFRDLVGQQLSEEPADDVPTPAGGHSRQSVT